MATLSVKVPVSVTGTDALRNLGQSLADDVMGTTLFLGRQRLLA